MRGSSHNRLRDRSGTQCRRRSDGVPPATLRNQDAVRSRDALDPRKGDEAVPEGSQGCGIHSRPLHDLPGTSSAIVRSARPSSVSAMSSTRSSATGATCDPPLRLEALDEGREGCGLHRQRIGELAQRARRDSHSASITRYCGWVSPSGSSTGRYSADDVACRGHQREAQLILELQQVIASDPRSNPIVHEWLVH